jgi:hypothetical protein
LIESNLDDELALLGQVRADVHAIVTRWLGEKPLTLDEVDALLANIAEDGGLPAPPAPTPIAFRESPQLVAAPVLAARAEAAPAPDAVAPAPAAVALAATAPALAEAPLTAAVAPLFDSRPVPPSNPPPVFDSRPPSDEPPGQTASVFDEKPDLEPETTAQAIVAAFEQPEVEQSTTEALAAELESSLSALESAQAQRVVEIDAPRSARKLDRGQGSRRPDLDELLDQPLDALDFDRTEPLDEPEDQDEAHAHSEMPTGAPPPGAGGDDFEILVDDEILEIAEDDVEIVNDDDSN